MTKKNQGGGRQATEGGRTATGEAGALPDAAGIPGETDDAAALEELLDDAEGDAGVAADSGGRPVPEEASAGEALPEMAPLSPAASAFTPAEPDEKLAARRAALKRATAIRARLAEIGDPDAGRKQAAEKAADFRELLKRREEQDRKELGRLEAVQKAEQKKYLAALDEKAALEKELAAVEAELAPDAERLALQARQAAEARR